MFKKTFLFLFLSFIVFNSQAEPASLSDKDIARAAAQPEESQKLVNELKSYCPKGCLIFNEQDWLELQLAIKKLIAKQKNTI